MARPRVFVSSTFYDLRHIRASLEVFIESLGYDSILFEKGDIAFHPDAPLDESCYREAASADIFVLIVGGRYGSAASGSSNAKTLFESYESITKREFEAAQEGDVPTFILLDSSVSAEYQTYLKNRGNESISYAHVDSVDIFKLLDLIFEKTRNNPVFDFERATQIESWLRDQWAGLFRELLKARSQKRQMSALNEQVSDLKSVNDTLKAYLEAVLSKVSPGNSVKIIEDQKAKLDRDRLHRSILNSSLFKYLSDGYGVDESEFIKIITYPKSADEAIGLVQDLIPRRAEELGFNILVCYSRAQVHYNEARELMGLAPLDFSQSKNSQAVATAMEETSSRRNLGSMNEFENLADRKGEPSNSTGGLRRRRRISNRELDSSS